MTTANLQLADNDTVIQYTAVGGETEFEFDFPVLDEAELSVSVDQVDQVLGTDYTVSGVGQAAGGAITFSVARSAGERITLWLEMPIKRLTGFTLGAAVLLPAALNTEFVRQVRHDQMLRRDIGRCLRLEPDDPQAGQDMVIPTEETRAGKALVFDAFGRPSVATISGSSDPSLRADLADPTLGQGADLIAGLAWRHVSRYGAIGDGGTDDTAALQDAFDAGATVRPLFDPGKVYAFESPLSIPAGVDVDFGGATLRKTTTDATDGDQLTVGAGAMIRNVTLEIPTGITILRGINLADRAGAFNVRVTSSDQQNNLGSDDRSAFSVVGDDTVVDGLRVENWDKAVRFEDCIGGWWSNIRVSSYATGIDIDDCTHFTLSNYLCQTLSPNGTTNPGHDGVVAENIEFAKLSNLLIHNAGEHGIYLSASCHRVGLSNVQIFEPGKSGMKISGGAVSGRMRHVVIDGLEVVDPSRGTTAGTNEEGLLLEYCDYVTINGFSLAQVDDADGAFRGIYILACTNVTIDAPVIREVASDAIKITDKNVSSGVPDQAETISNIVIRAPAIFSAFGHGINIEIAEASSVLRSVQITDAYIGAPSGFAVNIDALDANILQPIFIEGRVRMTGSGFYNNVQGNTDPLLNVRLRDVESREVVTGTVDLSVHGVHSVLNGAAAPVTATLPDGVVVGQRKTIAMSDNTNSGTVSVTSHETSSPEVFTFAQTSDVLVLEWTGSLWYTVKNLGVTA